MGDNVISTTRLSEEDGFDCEICGSPAVWETVKEVTDLGIEYEYYCVNHQQCD